VRLRNPPRRFSPLAALLAGLAFLPTSSGAAEFSLVSYNTHGLHRWISRDDPEARFPVIGERVRAGYDVVLLQEVFVADYGRRLGFGGGEWVVYLGNGPRPGPFGLMAYCGACGAGLVGAVRRPLEVAAVAAEPFTICAGKIRGAHDCWATKGMLFLRLRTPSGEEVDVYDLHLDAGDRGADFRARRAQVGHLGRELQTRSAGRAVVVAGDFNLKQGVQRDRELLDRFRAESGLLDSLARPAPERWGEVMDYILYRPGRDVALTVAEAGEARELLDAAGTPLSDHPALFARFRLEPQGR